MKTLIETKDFKGLLQTAEAIQNMYPEFPKLQG
jgi:hypothetical protein